MDGNIDWRGTFRWCNGNSFNGIFDSNKMRSGVFLSVVDIQSVSPLSSFISSSNNFHREYRAEFTEGDDIVNGFRMYRVKLFTVSEGELFKDCSFSNGQLIE